MKFNMKSIAAAVMLTMAGGGAQAAILSGYNAAGDGDLFISIFRNTASPQSMIIDTNVSLLGLQDGTVLGGWTSTAAQQAAISAFLGTSSLSNFLFNAGGVTNQVDFFDTATNNDAGFFVTTNSPVNLTTSNFSGSGLDASMSNINAFEVGMNNANPNMQANGNLITGILPGQQGYARDAFFWSTNVGNTYTSVNTEAAVGTPLSLWNFRNDSLGFGEYQIGWAQVGTLNINGATGVASLTTSAVPVPAAVWLFGSGLVGLVGVTRRKNV